MIEGFPGLIAIGMIGVAGVVMVRAFGPQKTHRPSRSDDGGGFWSSGDSSGSGSGFFSGDGSNHDSGSAADTGSSDSGGGGDGGGGGGGD